MKNFYKETITEIKHWNDSLFSFRCTRNPGLRFENGQFVMMGLIVDNKPIIRAYSIASPNYEEHLEFFSIKVPDGKLTSKLQNIKVGDQVIISKKPTGTILLHDLHPGKNLYLLSTGTGLAPFLSLVRDPEAYEKYEKIILVHGVRNISDLAYKSYIEEELPKHEYLGEDISKKLIYYPTVTREQFNNTGRITDLVKSEKLFKDLGLPRFDSQRDRVMVCGSTVMLNDTVEILDNCQMQVSPRIGYPGDYVIERAFVSK